MRGTRRTAGKRREFHAKGGHLPGLRRTKRGDEICIKIKKEIEKEIDVEVQMEIEI